MQNYIPYTDSGGKTRRYAIKLEDAIEFAKSFEQSPESYIAPKKNLSPRLFIMPKVDIEALRLNLEDEWFDAPLILDSVTVSRLTHYSDNAVNQWLVKSELHSVLTQNGRVTSREWLIDFFCGKVMRIVRKNEWHIEMLKSVDYRADL